MNYSMCFICNHTISESLTFTVFYIFTKWHELKIMGHHWFCFPDACDNTTKTAVCLFYPLGNKPLGHWRHPLMTLYIPMWVKAARISTIQNTAKNVNWYWQEILFFLKQQLQKLKLCDNWIRSEMYLLSFTSEWIWTLAQRLSHTFAH